MSGEAFIKTKVENYDTLDPLEKYSYFLQYSVKEEEIPASVKRRGKKISIEGMGDEQKLNKQKAIHAMRLKQSTLKTILLAGGVQGDKIKDKDRVELIKLILEKKVKIFDGEKFVETEKIEIYDSIPGQPSRDEKPPTSDEVIYVAVPKNLLEN